MKVRIDLIDPDPNQPEADLRAYEERLRRATIRRG